jgi:hypothetical protein
MTVTTDTRLTITAIRWRLLNRLGTAGAIGIRASELLDSQDGTDEDLQWLSRNELVVATLIGRTTRLDLLEHLTHHGSTTVLNLRLNARGRKVLQAWQNRVLQQLFTTASRRMPLRTLLANTGVDASAVAILCSRRLLTVAVRATGEQLTAADVTLLPPATLTVRLTDKGRTYLPL